MELNLLEKTELWINNIELKNANLNQVADIVAEILGMKRKNVNVVDVRDTCITLDILQECIKAEDIAGKQEEMLSALGAVEGVNISGETYIHSEGILGMISLDKDTALEAIDTSNKMVEEMKNRIRNRVMVFPTGFELIRGMIEDTNTPAIVERLGQEGYKVSKGEILDDDMYYISAKIDDAVNSGYGLVITTGGVGAEDKDKTVEAVLRLDRQAATPWIVKYTKGQGRHEKEGVRIAVGKVGETLIIALPGPNDEVRLALEVITAQLKEHRDKGRLADAIAGVLRDKLKSKYFHKHH